MPWFRLISLGSLFLGSTSLIATACSNDSQLAPAGNDAAASDAASPSPDDGGVGADAAADAKDDHEDTQAPPLDPSSSSQGTGGVVCEREDALGTADRRYCQITESAIEVRFVTPLDLDANTAPLHLALYLHGDGARAHESNSALRTLSAWADEHHAIAVSLRAPNSCSWWRAPSYDCESQTEDRDTDNANALALHEVLQKLRGAYDIANDAVFYYGSSGGSVFLTNGFFPAYGHYYPGAFALNCGGEAPELERFSWDTRSASLRGSTKFWFTYGSQDYLADTIREAIAFYTDRQVSVSEQVIQDAEHCQFDGHGRALEVWNEFLAP